LKGQSLSEIEKRPMLKTPTSFMESTSLQQKQAHHSWKKERCCLINELFQIEKIVDNPLPSF